MFVALVMKTLILLKINKHISIQDGSVHQKRRKPKVKLVTLLLCEVQSRPCGRRLCCAAWHVRKQERASETLPCSQRLRDAGHACPCCSKFDPDVKTLVSFEGFPVSTNGRECQSSSELVEPGSKSQVLKPGRVEDWSWQQKCFSLLCFSF
jgi:hypothetical protein